MQGCRLPASETPGSTAATRPRPCHPKGEGELTVAMHECHCHCLCQKRPCNIGAAVTVPIDAANGHAAPAKQAHQYAKG